MRVVVRVVAGLVFLAALLTTLEALRRLALDLLVHGSSPARLALFSVLAAVGALGVAGSISLARLREAGRKRALVYLVAVTPVLFFLPEEPTLRGLLPLCLAVGCAMFLAAPHVRQLCTPEARLTNESLGGEAMSSEENKQRIRRYFEAVDSGDQARALAAIDDLMAEDYVAHTAGATIRGRDALKEYARGVYATFGEMQHVIEDNLAAEGDKVVTRVRFRGVQKGEFVGLPPSGRRFECPIIYIHRFVGGRVQEAWLDWDSLFVVSRQLGAV